MDRAAQIRLTIYAFRQNIQLHWQQWTCHHVWNRWAIMRHSDGDTRYRDCSLCGIDEMETRGRKWRGKHRRGWEVIR